MDLMATWYFRKCVIIKSLSRKQVSGIYLAFSFIRIWYIETSSYLYIVVDRVHYFMTIEFWNSHGMKISKGTLYSVIGLELS